TLREKILRLAVCRDTKVDQRVIQPNLVSHRNKRARLVQVERGGFRVQRIQAKAHVLRAVVEKSPMKNVLRTEVVLQAQEVVAGPLRRGVGVIGQLADQRKCVLQADGIRKPEAAVLDGARKRKTRIPVSQAHALLNVDAGDWIGGADAPLVVAV